MIGQMCGEACCFFCRHSQPWRRQTRGVLERYLAVKAANGVCGPRGDAAWVTRCGGVSDGRGASSGGQTGGDDLIPRLTTVRLIVEQIQLVAESTVFESGRAFGKCLGHRHFLEEGDRENLEQSVERGLQAEAFLDNGNQDVDGNRDPYLRPHRVVRRAVKLLDPKMLFFSFWKFSLKQLTQQGSSEGLCVVSVLAATFTRMSPRRARGGFSSPKTASARRRDTRYSISAIRCWSFAAACVASEGCGSSSPDSRALR